VRYIGIDPGIKGGLAIVKFEEGRIEYHTFPFNNDCISVLKNIFSLRMNRVANVNLEKVHSLHGQGVTSTFTFGIQFGMLIGVMQALDVNYKLVEPLTWQRPFNLMANKSESPKKRAAEIFKKLVGEDKLTDGEIDAALIAISAFIKDYPEEIAKYFKQHKIIKFDEGEQISPEKLGEILWQK